MAEKIDDAEGYDPVVALREWNIYLGRAAQHITEVRALACQVFEASPLIGNDEGGYTLDDFEEHLHIVAAVQALEDGQELHPQLMRVLKIRHGDAGKIFDLLNIAFPLSEKSELRQKWDPMVKKTLRAIGCRA